MIQRVQSIWLLLTSLTLVCLLFLPLITKNESGGELTMYTCGLYQTTQLAPAQSVKVAAYLPLLVFHIFLAVLAFGNIFMFKNRVLQKRIAVITVILLTVLNFWVFKSAQGMPGGLENTTAGAGAFMPIVAIIWCFLAVRGIRNDERLIRSADRLR
ncbi:DUF4293 domain-containing protein [Pedobacter sp. MC2016-14]|uniref:DUF4293 domain-containing protein n=1 Tax=Pedobacter sp. MC2016-14 TaxID=2897327 RepID=UPI001E3B333A|nr:DUF4293 domain-containing protein [Pedobacter sp. MC2016-14]MCD0488050.1 DUF4293 domain-containing protein [Pedobacter sp. MC2016-14]